MTVFLPLTHIYHPSLRIHNHTNMHQGMHQIPIPDFGEQIGNKNVQMSQWINCK